MLPSIDVGELPPVPWLHQTSRLGALKMTISSFSWLQIPQVRRVLCCHYLSNSDNHLDQQKGIIEGLGVCPKVWNFLRFSILPALAIPYQLSSSSCKWSHSPGSEAPAQSPPAVPEGNVVKGCSSSDSVFEGNVFSVWFCVFMYICCLRAEA